MDCGVQVEVSKVLLLVGVVVGVVMDVVEAVEAVLVGGLLG